MKPARLLLLAAALMATCAATALAETPEQSNPEAEYTLGEVLVNDKTDALENSTTVTVITAEQIENSGAQTLADTMKLIPGVTTRTATDGTCRIDIRGMRTRQVKLLLNGIPFGSTFDGQFDPDSIPVENIARIKVSQGTTSVLYGDGGTAGVIDIITKKGTQETHGSAGVMAATGDLYKVKTTLSGGTEKLSLYAGASYLTRNGYPVSEFFGKTADQDSDLRKNSDREHINLLANAIYKLSDTTNIGATVNAFQGSYGKPPSAKDDNYAKNVRYDRLDYYDGIGTQLALDHKFTTAWSTRVTTYFNRQYSKENRYDDDGYNSQANNSSYRSRGTSTNTGFTNQWAYASDTIGTVTMGFNGEHQHYRETGFKGSNQLLGDHSLQIYSVALQDDITPVDDLQVSLGLSLNGQHKDDENNSTYTYVVAGNYQLLEGTNIKLSHARKVRFASVKNLYDSSDGNPDLDPEITWHYEAGVSQALPFATTAELTVFRLDAENYIEKDTGPYENHDKYQFRGVEFTLTSRFMEGLSTTLGYTYMESENLSDGGSNVLQYRPKHKATASATYKTSFGTTLFGSFRYIADQYVFDDNDQNPKALADYAIVDMKITQAITDSLSGYVGADNLTDTDYWEAYGFTRPGRVVYTGLDYKF